MPVNVLNNTTEHGLATSAAAKFRSRGWSLGTVGNFTGTIPATTVYFDPGNEQEQRAAHLLQQQFPGIARVLPHYAGLPVHGLTVVLTPDWN